MALHAIWEAAVCHLGSHNWNIHGKEKAGGESEAALVQVCPPTLFQCLLVPFWLLRSLLTLQPSLDPASGQVSSELVAGPAVL